MSDGTIPCPDCDGAGHVEGHPDVVEPCMTCREMGYLYPDDAAYPGAVERWMDRGVSLVEAIRSWRGDPLA